MVNFTIGPCSGRAVEIEWMDTPGISDQSLIKGYEFIERAQRLSGGQRALFHFLKKASAKWIPDQRITMLDLYCGRGALSQEILKWSRAQGWGVQILAVDRYGRILEMAKERQSKDPDLVFDVRDWNHPSFLQAQQFDYVISDLSLHHFDGDQAQGLLKTVNLLAKRGWFVGDWIRDLRAWVWMNALSRLSKEEVIRHDGPLAVKRSYALPEVANLAKKSGVSEAQLKTHMGIRFSLTSERGLVWDPKLAPITPLAGT